MPNWNEANNASNGSNNAPSERSGTGRLFTAIVMPLRRPDTYHSGYSARIDRSRRTQSFRSQAQVEQAASKPKRYQEKFSVYTGLTWGDLYDWLKERWPEEEFLEVRKGDYWIFEVPERLKDADKREISALKARAPDQRQSVSPEPS